MRTKKLLSIILTVLFVTSWLNGFDISVFADYSNADGIIQWDFAEYTDKITTTEAGFTEVYNGLTIAIANNGDDSISTGGVFGEAAATQRTVTARDIFHILPKKMEHYM